MIVFIAILIIAGIIAFYVYKKRMGESAAADVSSFGSFRERNPKEVSLISRHCGINLDDIAEDEAIQIINSFKRWAKSESVPIASLKRTFISQTRKKVREGVEEGAAPIEIYQQLIDSAREQMTDEAGIYNIPEQYTAANCMYKWLLEMKEKFGHQQAVRVERPVRQTVETVEEVTAEEVSQIFDKEDEQTLEQKYGPKQYTPQPEPEYVPVEEVVPRIPEEEEKIAVKTPIVEEPVIVKTPVVEEPFVVETPKVEKPIVVETPVVEEPVEEVNPFADDPRFAPAPKVEEPKVVEKPIAEKPAVEKPVVVETPIVEEPVEITIPKAEEPVVVETPVVEEPVEITIPKAEEPVVVETPVVEEPVEITIPKAEEPVVIETPVVEEPVEITIPKAEEPVVIETPKVEEPIVVETPIVTEPVKEEIPEIDDPIEVTVRGSKSRFAETTVRGRSVKHHKEEPEENIDEIPPVVEPAPKKRKTKTKDEPVVTEQPVEEKAGPRKKKAKPKTVETPVEEAVPAAPTEPEEKMMSLKEIFQLAHDLTKLDREENKLFELAKDGVDMLAELRYIDGIKDREVVQTLSPQGMTEALILSSTLAKELPADFNYDIDLDNPTDRYCLLLADSVKDTVPRKTFEFINDRIAFYEKTCKECAEMTVFDIAKPNNPLAQIYNVLYREPLAKDPEDISSDNFMQSELLAFKDKFEKLNKKMSHGGNRILGKISSEQVTLREKAIETFNSLVVNEKMKNKLNEDSAWLISDNIIKMAKTGIIGKELARVLPDKCKQNIRELSSMIANTDLSEVEVANILEEVQQEFIYAYSK